MENVTTDLITEEKQLMQLSRDWSDLIKTGDIDAIVQGWAEDAVIMAPGFPLTPGKAAIRAYIEESFKIPGSNIWWEPLEVPISQSSDIAYMIERSQVTMHDEQGNPVTESNKTVTVWRKDEDGNWKNVIDMWNADPSRS